MHWASVAGTTATSGAKRPKEIRRKKEVAEIDTIPLYNGTYVGVDLYGIGSKLLGGDFYEF